MKQFATIISRIFDPFIMMAVALGAFFYKTPIMTAALILMVGLPFVLFVLAWKMKFISNWDVRDRRERPKILWILLGIVVVAMMILQTYVLLPMLVMLFGFVLISHVWKISGHTMATALATGILVAKFGWAWWPVILTVPLVAWSRIQTKNHTMWQVIAGALYSWIFLVVFGLL